MQKWEYKVLLQMWDEHAHEYYWIDAQENEERGVLQRLNELGKEGWELIAVHPAPENSVHYFFKRPA